jgi:hypothetical protein
VNPGVIGRFGSPRARRIGSGVLAAMIIAYLAIITYSLSDWPDSPLHIILLGMLWCLGSVALILLVRSWRHTRA